MEQESEVGSTGTIGRIEKRREGSVNSEEIDESVKGEVEYQAGVIYELQAQIRHYYEQVKHHLPPKKEWTDEKGKKHSRPATWIDIQRWAEDGELEKYLTQKISLEGLDSPQKIKILVGQQLINTRKAIELQAELTAVYEGDNTEKEELTDEQKKARLMTFFRLRELAESRVKRKDIDGRLLEIRSLIDGARDLECWDMLEEYEEQEKGLIGELRDEIHSSPEAYYDYWGQELAETKQVFSEQGKIYETPYVKSKIGKMRSILRGGQGIFVHGETGSGKTEVLKYMADEYGKGYYLIPGHRNLELSDITETRDIKIEAKILPEEQRKEITKKVQEIIHTPDYMKRMQEWADFRGKSIDEINQEEIDKLESGYFEYYKNPVEITSKLQPLYESARDGKMIIIDEMNAIPHHTLIALNDLLTHSPVDQEIYEKYQKGEIKIQDIDANHIVTPIYGHDPIVIAPGFCVCATGNWKPEDGANYVGRQTLDSAFMRRFGIVDYDYLPNPTEGLLDSEDLDVERAQKEQAELYRMLCARVINKDLTAELPVDAFANLENLSQVAKIIQDGFSGKTIPPEFQPESLSGNRGKLKVEEVIKENVLDIGKLVQYIIEPWKKDNFRYPLEVYLFDRFITRSSARPQEMVFLYKAFQLRGFFQSSDGWPELIDIASQAAQDTAEEGVQSAPTAVDLQRIQNQKLRDVLEFGKKLEKSIYGKPDISYSQEAVSQIDKPKNRFYSPVEVIDRVIGRPPERLRFPDLARAVQKEGETTVAVETGEDFSEREAIRLQLDGFESRLHEQIDVLSSQLPNALANTPIAKSSEKAQLLLQQVNEFREALNNPLTPLEGEDGISSKYKRIIEAINNE